MHDLSVILTFTGGLAGALVLGFLAQRLRVSPIVGYLLAGILVGPFTPGFVANRAIAEQFAEIESIYSRPRANLVSTASRQPPVQATLNPQRKELGLSPRQKKS
jgi:hypothetical protein